MSSDAREPARAGRQYSAAVLWNGGISFGGAIAFNFADLVILPILNNYPSITE
jgi:hypothetical protein